MVRRGEASTASAFFSNEDVVSITADDDDDPKQQASAEVLKALLQYRLTKTIPWFLTLVGARQDAEVMGICIAKADWEYEERYLRTELRPKTGANGMPEWDDEKGEVGTESFDLYEKIKDRPYIDLIAPENFRFEPGCDWRNPVVSSPYIIELAPVYIQEAMERMEGQHGAPPEWERVPESALRGANDLDDDVTRRTRETGRVPGKDHDAWKPKDFDICWTRLNIVRFGGMDWCYRTLGSAGEILEPPRPIREVYLHGERPYVIGSCVLETHKTYPSSKIELTTDLQRAANQDWNTRFDNVMLALQPRQFVREGAGQDIDDLRKFMPGKTVMVNAGKGEPLTNTITWDRPPPVDAAAYQEQDRINLDWDDLTGAFTNSSQASSQITQQSATGMHLMSGEASGLNEYELRLFAETFVEPLLRLMIKLEQAYETDPVILALAGKKAQLFQKFNVSEITDELLNQGVTTKVNVGIGSTNPQMKLRNFATGAQILGSIFGQSAAQGANFQEVSKEVFGLLGYKDGERFFQPGFDPRVAMMQQQMQKMQGKAGGDNGQASIQVAQINAQSRQQLQQLKGQTDLTNAHLDYQTQKMEEDADTDRTIIKQQAEMHKLGLQHAHEGRQTQTQQAMDLGSQQMQHQHEVATQPPASGANAKAGSGLPAQQATPMPLVPPQATMQSPQTPSMPGPSSPAQVAAPTSMQQPSQPATASGAPGQQLQPAVPHEMGGNMQAGMQQIMTVFAQTMSQLAQSNQQGFMQIAQSMGQIGNMIADAAERSDQNLGQLVQGAQQSNQAVVAALTRKKRVVRGQDGRVEGVE
jgi:hypothetical protein